MSIQEPGEVDPRQRGQGKREWFVPLTGPLFLLTVILGFTIGGEPPDVTKDPVGDVVTFYADDTGVRVSAVIEMIAGASLVIFGGYFRRFLQAAEGPHGMWSAVMFAGTVIIAVGLAIDATITFAMVETAADIDPAAVQALSALYANDFLPLALGVILFLLATGVSIIRHRVLPVWLGWAAIGLAVLGATPLGFISAIATVLLVTVIGVMLALRDRKTAATPAR